MPDIERLTGVYHANGSLLGEIAYVLRKVAGTAHCALCDITHGPLREKEAWRACRDALEVPFETVHLDERDPDLAAVTEGLTPCVVAHHDDGSLRVVITAEQLDSCGGDVDRLAALLRAALGD